jgi:hypothetical protein
MMARFFAMLAARARSYGFSIISGRGPAASTAARRGVTRAREESIDRSVDGREGERIRKMRGRVTQNARDHASSRATTDAARARNI